MWQLADPVCCTEKDTVLVQFHFYLGKDLLGKLIPTTARVTTRTRASKKCCGAEQSRTYLHRNQFPHHHHHFQMCDKGYQSTQRLPTAFGWRRPQGLMKIEIIFWQFARNAAGQLHRTLTSFLQFSIFSGHASNYTCFRKILPEFWRAS